MSAGLKLLPNAALFGWKFFTMKILKVLFMCFLSIFLWMLLQQTIQRSTSTSIFPTKWRLKKHGPLGISHQPSNIASMAFSSLNFSYDFFAGNTITQARCSCVCICVCVYSYFQKCQIYIRKLNFWQKIFSTLNYARPFPLTFLARSVFLLPLTTARS